MAIFRKVSIFMLIFSILVTFMGVMSQARDTGSIDKKSNIGKQTRPGNESVANAKRPKLYYSPLYPPANSANVAFALFLDELSRVIKHAWLSEWLMRIKAREGKSDSDSFWEDDGKSSKLSKKKKKSLHVLSATSSESKEKKKQRDMYTMLINQVGNHLDTLSKRHEKVNTRNKAKYIMFHVKSLFEFAFKYYLKLLSRRDRLRPVGELADLAYDKATEVEYVAETHTDSDGSEFTEYVKANENDMQPMTLEIITHNGEEISVLFPYTASNTATINGTSTIPLDTVDIIALPSAVSQTVTTTSTVEHATLEESESTDKEANEDDNNNENNNNNNNSEDFLQDSENESPPKEQIKEWSEPVREKLPSAMD